MLHLIHWSIAQPDPVLPEIALPVERLTLAKRLWRGVAEDGAEFGFDLAAPLRHGETFFQTATARYAVRQLPEPVVEISLALATSAAAGIGWAIGNLHLELSAEPTRLLAPDEPAVRQLLDRLKVPFVPTAAVFRPGHFARGDQPGQELGPSHRHGEVKAGELKS
jgi:urease accessory protein